MERLQLLDRKQLAKTLGVTVRTISNWRRSGKIPEPLIPDRNRPFWSIRQIERWQSGKLRESRNTSEV